MAGRQRRKGRRILVLFYQPGPGKMRVAIERHLRALEWSDRAHSLVYANVGKVTPGIVRSLNPDVVVLHTTLLALRWNKVFYLWKWRLRWLGDLRCLKIAMPQDEYDLSELLDDWLYELGVRVIFSNFGEQEREALYPVMSGTAVFYRCLTGYIDDRDAQRCAGLLRPHPARPYDIVYRGRDLPYWFGSHGQMKYKVAAVVAERAAARGMACNISTFEKDTLVGEGWLDLLASGRSVIGCESGSSVLDPRGAIQARIQTVTANAPDLSFEEVSAAMPKGWDDYRFVSTGPRHLEAVMTKTCQVLVEGDYDGVLRPHEHYLPLKADFSNLDETLEKIADRALLDALTERAYRDVYLSGHYSYRRLAETVDDAIDRETGELGAGARGAPPLMGAAGWALGKLSLGVAERAVPVLKGIGAACGPAGRLLGLMGRPVTSVRKAGLAARLVLGHPAHRKLLAACLKPRLFRSAATVTGLARDLLTVSLLRMLNAGRVPGLDHMRIDARFRARHGALILLSQPREAAVEVSQAGEWSGSWDGVKTLVWDHAKVGQKILYPLSATRTVNLFLGRHGVYEFTELLRCPTPLVAEVWRDVLPLREAPR